MSGYVSTDDGRMVRVRSLGPHTTIGGNGPDDGPQWRSRRPTAWLGRPFTERRARKTKICLRCSEGRRRKIGAVISAGWLR